MAGQTMRILPRTDYTFTTVAASSSLTVLVARKIDTSAWREGVLLARLHASSYVANQILTIKIAPDGYTDEDPGLVWNSTPTTLITFTGGTDTVPNVKNAEIAVSGGAFGPLAQILLTATQNAAGGAFTASLSIDLNLKGQ